MSGLQPECYMGLTTSHSDLGSGNNEKNKRTKLSSMPVPGGGGGHVDLHLKQRNTPCRL
jgi:hypothetical protein